MAYSRSYENEKKINSLTKKLEALEKEIKKIKGIRKVDIRARKK